MSQPDAQAKNGRAVSKVSNSIGAFWADVLQGSGTYNVTLVAMSEFGRNVRENGNQGTDHGHGSVFWVLGGGVRGNKIAGEQVAVAQNTLFQNRDFPVLNDYRAVLGGLFARLYGLSPAQCGQVFAGVAPKDLGLL